MKSKIAAFWLALILSVYGLSACERSAQIVVTTDNPPTIKLSGDALFDWLGVRGPLPERMDDEGPAIIWKLVPPSSPPQLNSLPAITYGTVPPQLIQTEPKTGRPPVLMEGKIYSIGVTTRGSNHPHKTIVIRSGKAEEFSEEDYKVDNTNLSSFLPTDVRNLHGAGRVYFVPVMNYAAPTLERLAEYEKKKYEVPIEIKPNLPTSFSDTYDQQTGQHIAEKIIESLKQQYPPNASEERAIYIGFLPQDMYIKGQKSRFAYVYHDDGYAVISDARLAIFANDSQQTARLRKLVNRIIGTLYYNLPSSEDRRSVLFKDLRGPDDLDRMSEDF